MKNKSQRINRHDVTIEKFRGSGPGGQHRNKTETCVRLTHKPTGIVARGTSERSLSANLAAAWGLLEAKIAAQAEAQRAEQASRRRLELGSMGFGAGVRRSYFLAGATPRVVDHVSERVADPRHVLAGALELVWGR